MEKTLNRPVTKITKRTLPIEIRDNFDEIGKEQFAKLALSAFSVFISKKEINNRFENYVFGGSSKNET